jgi:hypothetical protein
VSRPLSAPRLRCAIRAKFARSARGLRGLRGLRGPPPLRGAAAKWGPSCPSCPSSVARRRGPQLVSSTPTYSHSPRGVGSRGSDMRQFGALARGNNRIMAQRARDVVLPARHVHAAWASSCFARSAWLRPSAGSRFAPHVLAVSNEAPRSWKVLRRGTSSAQYFMKVRRMLASLPRVSGVSAHCDI